jgi:hypothetical protein
MTAPGGPVASHAPSLLFSRTPAPGSAPGGLLAAVFSSEISGLVRRVIANTTVSEATLRLPESAVGAFIYQKVT